MLAIAAVSALAVGTAVAREGNVHGGMHGKAGHRAGARGELREVLSQLDLSDDQKAGIRGIFQSQRPILEPLTEQAAEARVALVRAIHASTLDEGSVRAASDRLAKTQLALALERARTAARVRELLTPEQRKTLDTAREARLSRAQERAGHRRGMLRNGLDDSSESF